MAILRHFPKKTVIRDRRNEDGGYYEAKCEECGVIFYPSKIAKYCSQLCTQRAYNKRKKLGLVKAKEPVLFATSEKMMPSSVRNYIISKYSILNNEEFLNEIKNDMDNLEMDKHISYEFMQDKKKYYIRIKRVVGKPISRFIIYEYM